jgi:hypothetical protein
MLDRLDTLIAFATVLLGVSLLITILNQIIANLFGYRAAYLKDGIKDLLETLDPSLKDQLDSIVDKVMTHKLASDSIFAHQEWAPKRWRLASAIRPEELGKLLRLVSQGEDYAPKIDAILTAVNPALKREATLINDLAPNANATADQLFKQLSTSAIKAVGRLEASFDSTVDRVRQRFTLQMRIWTIVFAMLFAFGYQLDAVKIYSRLATEPVLRSSVSNLSDGLMKEYEKVIPQPSGAGAGQQATQTTDQAASANTLTPEQQEEQQKALDDRTKQLGKAYVDVRNQLSQSNLQLFEIDKDKYKFWDYPRETVGMLAMAAMLSLGAPFWYNTLKGLVNLKSQVAQKQDEEKKS